MNRLLVEWTTKVVVRIQLGGKRQHGTTILGRKRCIDLCNHLRSGERIIDIRAGRVKQCCNSRAEKNTCRGVSAGAALIVQCTDQRVICAISIEIQFPVDKEGTNIEHSPHERVWSIGRRPRIKML
jgi:hypothetical protein